MNCSQIKAPTFGKRRFLWQHTRKQRYSYRRLVYNYFECIPLFNTDPPVQHKIASVQRIRQLNTKRPSQNTELTVTCGELTDFPG